MKQTEITVEVFDSLEEIKKILTGQNFEIVETYALNDFYFSKFENDILENMNYKNIMENSFLVRQIISSQTKTELIFKNKIIDKNNVVIEEEKIPCVILDLENALKIFHLAKLNCWCKLKQNIVVFKKKEIEFCVSEIKNLGIFIEYEQTENMNNLSAQEKIEFMKNILKSLNLNIGNDFSCKKAYLKFLKK